jgi:endonuclease YncB( thermonuclease family)
MAAVAINVTGCTDTAPQSTADVRSSPVVAVESSGEDGTSRASNEAANSVPIILQNERSQNRNEIIGRVVAVIDGDTIDILNGDKKTIRIRLNGIDAPERDQPFGNNAKQYLSREISGKIVRVVKRDVDPSGSTIGDVYLSANVAYSNPANVNLPDMFLNRELVSRGLAWHDRQSSDDQRLTDDEDRAKAKGLGLWSDPRRIAPWKWRKMSEAKRDTLR